MRRLPAITLTLALLAACSSKKKETADAMVAAPTAFAAAGNFTAGDPGVLVAIDTQTQMITATAPQGAVGDDPQMRLFGGKLYVINRSDGDNITILNTPSLTLVDQLATGASSNPQDVAVTSSHLYAPILGGSGVAVLTPGSATPTVIDLSAGAANPGVPDCIAAALVGTQLFVACEELGSNFMPSVPGKVFIIDTTSNAVTGSFNLMNENPVGEFRQMPNGDLAIETVPSYTASPLTGCIEQITTTGTPASAGCVVSNATLGATVNRFEIQANAGSDTLMWLSLAGPGFASQWLASYDLTTSTLSPPISPSTEQIGDFALCSDGMTIVVSDQTKNASGVRIYRNGHEVTTAPIAIGLDTMSNYALECL